MIRSQHSALIFIPTTNELQRFVLTGAFTDLEAEFNAIYVVPADKAERMRAEAGDALPADRLRVLDVPPERFAEWADLFKAACVRYGERSRSFKLRTETGGKTQRGHPLVRAWPAAGLRLIRGGSQSAQAIVGAKSRLGGIFKRLAASSNTELAYRERGWFNSPARYRDRVEQSLSKLGLFEPLVTLLEQEDPLFCVVPSSLLDPFCNEVLWACDQRALPCLILQSGWDNMSSKGVLHHRSCYAGVWGEQSKRHAVEIQGLSPERCVTVGSPHYEVLRPLEDDRRTALRQTLGVSEEERLILFGGCFRPFDEVGVLQRLEAAIERGDLPSVKVLYRPHPWRADREHEDSFFDHQWRHVIFDDEIREQYLKGKAEAGYTAATNALFSMEQLRRRLGAVDAVISPMSTLLVESLIMAKPTVAACFSDGKHAYSPDVTAQMTHFDDLRAFDSLRWCRDADELVALCTAALQSTASEAVQHDVDRHLDNLVVRRPGTYASRLAGAVRQTIYGPALNGRRAQRRSRLKSLTQIYDGDRLLHKYCHLEKTAPAVPGYWMHGWFPAYHNLHPAIIALHKSPGRDSTLDWATVVRDDKRDAPQWVGRSDQAQFLREHGYQKVEAIGLPIAYTPPAAVERVPNSLLIMPPHGHETHGPDDPLARALAEAIAAVAPQFDVVKLCVTDTDLIAEQWVPAFRAVGIDAILGASSAEPNSLLRMRDLLSSFEFVTTNGFGSQIAYAACFGAKVSIYGPYAEFPADRLRTLSKAKVAPEVVEPVLWTYSEEAMRQHYPELFCEPGAAVQRLDWGRREIGIDERPEPQELCRLFGWTAPFLNPDS